MRESQGIPDLRRRARSRSTAVEAIKVSLFVAEILSGFLSVRNSGTLKVIVSWSDLAPLFSSYALEFFFFNKIIMIFLVFVLSMEVKFRLILYIAQVDGSLRSMLKNAKDIDSILTAAVIRDLKTVKVG